MYSFRLITITYIILFALIYYSITLEIPDEYDIRLHYNCQSFYDIRDQMRCGGCWAFAVAEVISDRYCINSNGRDQLLFSEMELLTCCKTLEDDPIKAGCSGGYPKDAFQYWVNNGLPIKSCKEFLFTKYEFPENNTNKLKCLNTCSNKGLNLFRYKGSYVKRIIGGEEEIKKEIYTNGPVTASFDYYEDFGRYWYKLIFEPNKIYQHSDEEITSSHAVKIIGWGMDPISKIKYWLCVNSWGKNDYLSGVFRFIRGINDCGIESNIYAGYIDKILYSINDNDLIYVLSDTFISFKNLDQDFK